jgi:hypothetical protein
LPGPLEYLHAFATISMALLLASSFAYVYQRYLIAALGFLAVGFGGSAVVWSRWSERAGYHNSFVALLHPTGLAFDEAFLLATHTPFMLVGAAVLFFRVARQDPRA